MSFILYPALLGLVIALLVWLGDRPLETRLWMAPIAGLLMALLFFMSMWTAPSAIPLRHFVPKPHYSYQVLEVLP